MTELEAAVCSITSTKRGRFFWAAWITAQPKHTPFQRPDASNGGAATHEEALREAERATGRTLTVIDSYWARAWNRMLRGEAPPPPPARHAPAPARPREERASAWTILGLEPNATADEVKRAYRKRAKETHPDQGGDPAVFRAVHRAYERLVAKQTKAARPGARTRR